MNDLRTAAQQALEAWDGGDTEWFKRAYAVMEALRAALAEPPVDDPHRDHWIAIAEAAQKIAASKECGLMEAKALCAALDRLTDAALAEPVQEAGDFDHGIGADRFRVVRGAFWWHVLIGDSPTEHGKFHSRASAEKMAADLLREFRNGAFVQYEAALAEPQEPGCRDDGMPTSAEERHLRRLLALCAAMPHAYYDDGEAQGTEHGISIDFMREPVAHIDAKLRALNVARAIAKQAEPVQDHFPDATKMVHEPVQEAEMRRCPRCWEPMFPPHRAPLTVERLRDALVSARIVPPAAVEDPDGYDDGVTLLRIEELHRWLA